MAVPPNHTSENSKHPPPPRDERVVIVADAHVLGPGSEASDAALLDFLAEIPNFADRLIINGDLFDFWFEYRAVVPRKVFPWLSAISQVRRAGVKVILTGGNHDRWGGSFWPDQVDVAFAASGFEDTLAGHRAWVHHGDGLSEDRLRSALFHKMTRNSLMVGAFRLIHPDIGFWLIKKLYGSVRGGHTETAAYEGFAQAQKEYATGVLGKRPELNLVVLSHVHRPALVETEPGRWFLNPGPWLAENRYALVTKNGPQLLVWG